MLREIGEKRLHFGEGVRVIGFGRGGHAEVQHSTGFASARFPRKKLGIHKVCRNVAGIALQKLAEVGISGLGIAGVHALDGEAVSGEGVVGFPRDKLFEHLAAGFLLFRHSPIRIIAEVIAAAGKPQRPVTRAR